MASPTLIPLRQRFPLLLPTPPQPHPTPLPRRGRPRVRLSARRDINRELQELSEEEAEIEEQHNDVKNRGYTFLVPLGRQLTQQEEKNEQASSGSSDAGSERSGEVAASEAGDGFDASAVDADASGQDLDASLDDMDAQDAQDGEEEEDAEADEEEEEVSGVAETDQSMDANDTAPLTHG